MFSLCVELSILISLEDGLAKVACITVAYVGCENSWNNNISS